MAISDDIETTDKSLKIEELLYYADRSRFWRERQEFVLINLMCPSGFSLIPYTVKGEILIEQRKKPPYGSIPSIDPVSLVRLHQSSGTSGCPLVWGDSVTDWLRILTQWDELFQIAGVGFHDRLFFPFSFGPFLGFWSAFEAATRSGWFCLPGGGLSSLSRLRLILDHEITVVLTTPSYALYLGNLAKNEGIDLRSSAIRLLILAGEPGACLSGMRDRIEEGWGAKVLDHHGMTETGPVSMECPFSPGYLHLLSSHFVIEFIPLNENGESELVLTPLGRLGMPLLRYRTGDRVKPTFGVCPCGRNGVRLHGGILGRLDDMVIIRGNNLDPQAVEDWFWKFPQIVDFRAEVKTDCDLAQLFFLVEIGLEYDSEKFEKQLVIAFSERFFFGARFQCVRPGTLPIAQHKSKRWIINSQGTSAIKT